MTSIISEGKTTTEAIENGLKQLNVSKKDVNIRVIEEENENIIMHKKINNNYYKELREAKESYKKARELDDLYKTIKYKVEECSYNYHLIKEYIDAL